MLQQVLDLLAAFLVDAFAWVSKEMNVHPIQSPWRRHETHCFTQSLTYDRLPGMLPTGKSKSYALLLV